MSDLVLVDLGRTDAIVAARIFTIRRPTRIVSSNL